MKKIVKVCQRDLYNMTHHPVTLIIILGVLVLPALYAWINIKASWDPYANTSKIAVAIVNSDKGTTFDNEAMNIGDEVVHNLKGNDKIGWAFVSSEEADNGLLEGRYYAALEITESFSEDLMSIVSDEPVKPKLIYKVDAKANPVAIKIAGASETSIVEEITKSFIYEVNEKLFAKANSAGTLLEENQAELLNLKDTIIALNQKMELILSVLEGTQQNTEGLQKYLREVQKGMVQLTSGDEKLQVFIKNKQTFINEVNEILEVYLDHMTFNQLYIEQGLQNIEAILISATNTQETYQTIESRSFLNDLLQQVELLETFTESQIELLEIINKMTGSNHKLNLVLQDLKTIKENLSKQENQLREVRRNIQESGTNQQQILKEMLEQAQNSSVVFSKVSENYNEALKSEINGLATRLNKTLETISKCLEQVKTLNEEMNKLLEGPLEASSIGENISEELYQALERYKVLVEKVSDTLQGIDNTEIINFIAVLQSSPNVIADFMAEPVELIEKPVYPVPNYGSAMAPIYTTLAIWVGGLILMAILSTEVKAVGELQGLSAKEKYFGKMLTFIFLSVIQSMLIVLGDVYILGVYTSHTLLFMLFGICAAVTFMTIIYTLVANFGNVGKALAIIGLILQVAGSGGAYPIQVDPKIFRVLQPYLPFTYVMGGIREAIAGPLPVSVFIDLAILMVITGVFLIGGYFGHEPLIPVMTRFKEKFKESGLAEEE